MGNTRPARTGRKLTDVTEKAWTDGFTVSSNYARENAPWVAAAACEGLITTKIDGENFSRVWRVTPEGVAFLFKQKGLR